MDLHLLSNGMECVVDRSTLLVVHRVACLAGPGQGLLVGLLRAAELS